MNETKQKDESTANVKPVEEAQLSSEQRFKLGVRYLHPRFREVILKDYLMIDGHPSADSFYAVLNSGEARLVSAYNLGAESPVQSKPCAGCGKTTEPLDFSPHRRKCKNCVRIESRDRKRDVRRTESFFMMMRLQEVLKNDQGGCGFFAWSRKPNVGFGGEESVPVGI